MDERKFWVAFNLIKGVGAVRFQKLLDEFGSLSSAWQAPIHHLRVAGLPEKSLLQLQKIRQEIDLEKYLQNLEKKHILILTLMDDKYPKRLREIPQPPPVIYYRGDIEAADDWAVAIVGTRGVTTYGRQITQDTAAYLAANGITIVSGLARGVDAIAHQSALDANGRTIAVLGSGVDVIYPPENRKLAEAISENGAIVSDYAPGTQPDGANFPPRNRIISGLSRATVVIEAGQKSGALITARFAVDQGRDVFAVPGSILSPMSKGTNQLVTDGAIPLTNPKDILDVLGYSQIAAQSKARTQLPDDPEEVKIYQGLGFEPTHVDELCNRLNMPIEKLTALLTMMELKGFVKQAGGMQYMIIREPRIDYHAD